MEITDVGAVAVEGNFYWPIIRIETDEGIVGYGEGREHGEGPYSPYVDDPVDQLMGLREFLVGKDPTDVARRFEEIREYGIEHPRGTLVAGVCAVETALWDIVGKTAGLPAYKLMGGSYRDEIRIYCDCRAGEPISEVLDGYGLDENDYSPAAYAEHAARREEAFDFVKFDLVPQACEQVTGQVGVREGRLTRAGLEYMVEVVAAIRDAIRDDTDVAFDMSAMNDLPQSDAIRFCEAVDDYDIAYIEDIRPNDAVEEWADLTDRIRTPTNTGEFLFSVEGFRDLIVEEAVRVPHADIGTSGGVHETVKIGELAAAHGLRMALHWAGSPIGQLAGLHVAAALPNLLAVEHHAIAVDWWNDLLVRDEPVFEDGYAPVPEEPGIGAEPDMDVVAEHAVAEENFLP
jgi:L-alanine-DL-glutamate epimerase-like enolase superfamily enzyme